MRPIFRCYCLAFLVLCQSLVAIGQEAATPPPIGLPVDWSFRHLITSRAWTAGTEAEARREPRALYNWLLRARNSAPAPGAGDHYKVKFANQVDWNFTLGTGRVAVNMSPAKFTFNVAATPSCASDYVVYGLNVAGSGSQPNLVRFNNLYAGSGGLCGNVSIAGSPAGAVRSGNVVTITTTTPHSFTVGMQVAVAGVATTSFNGTFAVASVPSATSFTYAQVAANATSGGGTASLGTGSVLSAYNITTLGSNGAVLTSPALSLLGTQVAFIETVTAPSASSIFHVLTLGTTGSNGSFSLGTNSYTTATPGSGNNAVMTSLAYSTSATTFSSPWIDYHNDVAYFGDDNGKLYKTTCVFYCALPALAAGWPIPVAAAGVKLGPAVLDPISNRIFVGGSDGNLYMVDLAVCPAGCAAGPRPSTAVGSANTFGGVIDAPLVDTTFETIFAFAGDDGTGSGIVLQTNTTLNLAPNLTVSMGSKAFFDILDGALDDTYYTNTTSSATAVGHLFACGQTGGSGQPALYTIPFTNPNSPTLLSAANPPRMGAGSHQNVPGNPGIGCSPITEFKNGATDRVFFSQSQVPARKCTSAVPVDGCMFMYDITSGSPSVAPTATAVENGGTSAIIVDNTSASGQASSIYFSNQATTSCTIGAGTPAYCAIKLTQSALN